jgi:hypothetical protein
MEKKSGIESVHRSQSVFDRLMLMVSLYAPGVTEYNYGASLLLYIFKQSMDLLFSYKYSHGCLVLNILSRFTITVNVVGADAEQPMN